MSDDVRRGKETVEHADSKLRHRQVASEPGTPLYGQRQTQAADEGGVIEG
jgi:hypothetical protein